MTRFTRTLLVCTMLSTLAACSTVQSKANRALDKTANQAVDRAAKNVGDRVGDAVSAAVLARLEPGLMHLYTKAMFNVLFFQGGYYMQDMASYEPGQYTLWKGENIQQGEDFERVLLRRHDNGSEWWRVESRAKDSNNKDVTLIMEALLSPIDASGTREVRRMRAKFPGEDEPREIAITQDNANDWMLGGNKELTQESLQGMTVEPAASVKVPAGTFTARHIRMDGYEGASKLDWYLVQEEVPGGVVKYTNTGKKANGEEEVLWSMVLLESGEGRDASKLGVDLEMTSQDEDELGEDELDEEEDDQ